MKITMIIFITIAFVLLVFMMASIAVCCETNPRETYNLLQSAIYTNKGRIHPYYKQHCFMLPNGNEVTWFENTGSIFLDKDALFRNHTTFFSPYHLYWYIKLIKWFKKQKAM